MNKQILELSKDIDDYVNGETKRYNGKNKIKDESIAEHSFMVAMNIIKVCKILDIDDQTRNKAATMGILHDISERFIGDIAWEFKSNPNNKFILNDLFDKSEMELYNSIYKHTIGDIYKEMIQKDDLVCDRLVKLSDSLAVTQYTTREILLGNDTEVIRNINYQAHERVKYDYNKLINLLDKE